MPNRPSTANPRTCRYLIASLKLGRVLAACNIGNDPGEKIVWHKPPKIFLLHLLNCHSGESAKTTRMPGPTLEFKQFLSDAPPAAAQPFNAPIATSELASLSTSATKASPKMPYRPCAANANPQCFLYEKVAFSSIITMTIPTAEPTDCQSIHPFLWHFSENMPLPASRPVTVPPVATHFGPVRPLSRQPRLCRLQSPATHARPRGRNLN